MLNHFVLRWFHLLDLSCERGFSLHNDDWGSKGGSELLCQYPDRNNTLGITQSNTALKVVPEFVIT